MITVNKGATFLFLHRKWQKQSDDDAFKHPQIVLLFVRSGDEECVDLGVLVMSDLDDELWDSQPDVVE